MSGPLPFADLLAALKERGLPIGVGEHLLVGRLLDRWSGTDLSGLRTALAAVLARSPEEVWLVRATFDELYLPKSEPPPSPSPPPPLPQARRHWGRIAAICLALTLIGSALGRDTPPPVEVPPSNLQEHLGHSPSLPPPVIRETFRQPDPVRTLAAAVGAALLTFLWVYGVRLQRTAVHLARRRWTQESEALPPPHRYDLPLEKIGSTVPASVLDEAARLLGRLSPVPPNPRDLDVDRSVDRTLRAGLAPQIVLQKPASPPSLLVLEDTSGAMHPWRRRVRDLLADLAQRGVPLDVWRFHANAGRVFRSLDEEELPLERIARLKPDSPLLVISSGEGFLTGPQGRLASWAKHLALWEYRAWLHPVTDKAYWRPELRRIPIEIWPLTPGGLLAAVRRLAGLFEPPGYRLPVFPDRPVTPFDVDCLRWLLSLVPRRDPDLIELLRRRFFPRLPPAALIEALAAPPLAEPPVTEPAPAEVHAFLADLLAAVRVQKGSAAHARSKLDHALQEIRVPEREEAARLALSELSRGPLAGEVDQAVELLPSPWTRRLQGSITARAAEEGRAALAAGTRRRWRWPDRFEIAATLLCGLLLFFGSGWFFVDRIPVKLVETYDLRVLDSGRPGPFTLLAIRPIGSPLAATLYRQNQPLREVVFSSSEIPIRLENADRESWYYLRAPVERGWLPVSDSVWVGAARPSTGITPPEISVPREPKPVNGERTSEPLGTEAPPKPPGPPEPGGEESSSVRFGTLTPDGRIAGAPTMPVIDESPPTAQEEPSTGTLVITEYPSSLPPGLVHIVGPGMPPTGAPWDGEAVRLGPGNYLVVVQAPRESLLLERIEVRTGGTYRIQISQDMINQIRSMLVEGGLKITSVAAEANPGFTGGFDLIIQGEGFSPGARVEPGDSKPLPYLRIGPSCQITSQSILCHASTPPVARYLEFSVKVINPDGSFAEGRGELFLDGGY